MLHGAAGRQSRVPHARPPRAFVVLALILLASSSAQAGPPPTVTDVDGNEYRTVLIGSHLWLAENLRVTRSPDAAPLPSFAPDGVDSNIAQFGRLYAWESALKACPVGWHLPTDAEWSALEAAGAPPLQLRDPAFWSPTFPTTAGALQLGVRPAGYSNDEGFDNYFRSRAVFWSASRQDEHFVWSRVLAREGGLRRAPQHPRYRFSVRCIQSR